MTRGTAHPTDVLIRPLSGGRVVVVGSDDGSTDWTPLASAAAATVRAVLGLSSGSLVGQRCFTLAPESLAALETDNAVKVAGGYFRGVLTNDQGKFSHQVRLKEIDSPGLGLDPLGVANAVQIAALKAQLDRLEELLAHGVAVIEAVKDHLDVQQAAEINAALTTLRRICEDMAHRGDVLGEIDWTRVAHLEHVLTKGLDAIDQELESVARRLRFSGKAAEDVKVVDAIQASRILTLVQMHLAVEAGLQQWVYLMAVRKHEQDEHDAAAIERHYADLEASTEHRHDLIQRIRDAVTSAPRTHGRPWYELLLGPGLPLGWDTDEKRVKAVEGFKGTIESSELLRKAAQHLPESGDRLSITAQRPSIGSTSTGADRLMAPCGTMQFYDQMRERSSPTGTDV